MTNLCIWIINIITTTTTFLYFNTRMVKYRIKLLILITFGLVLHSGFFIEMQIKEVALNEVMFVKFYKIVNPMKNALLIS